MNLRAAHWTEKAACAAGDPEIFYLERGESSANAKRICMSCEVRQPCLQRALADNEKSGIWGGLTVRECRQLQSRKQNIAGGEAAA